MEAKPKYRASWAERKMRGVAWAAGGVWGRAASAPSGVRGEAPEIFDI